jgi:hypothetical protein
MVIYGVYRYGGQWEDSWDIINEEMYQTPEDAEKWLLDNGYEKHNFRNDNEPWYSKECGMWDEWEGARIKEFYVNHICPTVPDRIIDNGIGC